MREGTTLRLPSRPPPTAGRKGKPRRSRRGLIAGLVAIGLVSAVCVGAWAWWNGSMVSIPIREHCTATVTPTPSTPNNVAEITPEQAGNAAIISSLAGKRGLPARAASIAIATAIQESKLRNIEYGDRDSLGLFQQRPSQGWGTRKQITNPVYATNAFYDVLAKVDGYETMEITKVAQKVQRSAFPDAYADHEPEARVIASALTGYSPSGFTCVLRASDAVAQKAEASGRTARARALVSAASKETGRKDPETVGSSGKTLRFTVPESANDRSGWALAHWAVARAAGLEVVRVDVANQRWDRGHSTEGWTNVKTGLPNGAVVITVS